MMVDAREDLFINSNNERKKKEKKTKMWPLHDT